MRQIIINTSNRAIYTIVAMMIVVLVGAGILVVNAYGGSSPSVVGHSAGEVEGTISSGFCVFSDSQSSCPSGWTRDSSFDSRTIRGASSGIGTTGGSDTHTHTTGNHVLTINEMPSHNHAIKAYTGLGFGGGDSNDRAPNIMEGYKNDVISSKGGNAAHNHGDTGSESSWSPYINVIVCCKN